MLRLLLRWVGLLGICSAPALANTLCVTGTLASYEALGAGGCQIGSLNVVNFAYTPVSGDVTIPDTAITVTPDAAPGSLDLTFSSGLSSPISGGDSAVYLLSYTWDIGDIRSLEDILNSDPPVFPGLVRISTLDCEDAAFVGSSCIDATDTLVVSDNGNTHITPASVSFSPGVGLLGIRDTITLNGGGAGNGGSANYTSFENDLTITPEPSTVAPCLLLGLLMWGRLRLKRL
jgi:hypothetical protein